MSRFTFILSLSDMLVTSFCGQAEHGQGSCIMSLHERRLVLRLGGAHRVAEVTGDE